MFHIYVLRSEMSGRPYTGACEDVDRQIREHNSGHTKSTRHRKTLDLVHVEEYKTSREAFHRERFLKTGRGRDELDRIVGEAQRR